jgi:fructokinase
MKIISIGAILWDVFDESELIGGAPLNFSAHASKLGHEALLVSALGDDRRGQRAFERLAELGLSPRFVYTVQGVATGAVDVLLDGSGNPTYQIHRPAAYDFPRLTKADLESISSGNPAWIYYGTLEQLSPSVRELTQILIDRNPQAERFYDVNLRKDSYNTNLVRDLMHQASVVKLNEQEAHTIMEMFQTSCRSLEEFCRIYSKEFVWKAVCVTRGEEGCCILLRDEYIERQTTSANVVDTVGGR